MAVGRNVGCEPTGSSAIRSAIPKNPILKLNTKWIGWPVAEIWPLEIFKMAAGRHFGFDRTGNSTIRSIVPENPTLEPNTKLIGSPIANAEIGLWQFEIQFPRWVWFYAFCRPYWIFGRHLGFEAKSEVAQERFSNSMVWGTWIHWENFDRKKWQFLPGLDLTITRLAW